MSKRISIEGKKIKVIEDWPEPKSVRDIQVFLGFINCYWRFIQGLSKIATSLILILKTIESLDKPAPNRNNGSKPASSKNNSSKPAFRSNNGNSEVRFNGNSVEHAKKSGKSKGQKLAKSKKLSKLLKLKSKKSKKLSKCRNSPNFDTIKTKLSFLIPDIKTLYNNL